MLLIATLVLVAFGITYTLLTLNRGQDRPPPDERPAVNQPLERPDQPLGEEVLNGDLPVIPDGLAQDGAAPVAPEAPAENETEAAETESAADEDEAAAEEEEAAPPRVLAEGEVQLEGVGFSFVTGGAGACGVILEPWEHVAVSRDLLADLGCGASVQIELDDEIGGHRTVNATIGDTMNPSHTLTVNVYVGEDEPAFEYGRTGGVLTAP